MTFASASTDLWSIASLLLWQTVWCLAMALVALEIVARRRPDWWRSWHAAASDEPSDFMTHLRRWAVKLTGRR